MATNTGTPKAGPVGTAVLEQPAELEAKSISPETARELLQLRFDASHHERVDDLSQKAQTGTLTPNEQDDPDECMRFGTLPSILQSRARQALKKAGRTL